MDAGWTAFPSVIIENQAQLGLDFLDLNVILFLASKWWHADGKPFPAKKTMAKTMGVDARTIQKRIAALEKACLIRREERRSALGSQTNIYHLDGLIQAAKPFADEKLKERAERREDEHRRLMRRGAPRPGAEAKQERQRDAK
jgi:predicted transcriptional regulator